MVRGAFDVCPKVPILMSDNFKGQKDHFSKIMIFELPEPPDQAVFFREKQND